MTRLLPGFAVAAMTLLGGTLCANANVIFTSQAFDGPVAAGEIMVQNFDSPLAAGYSMSWSNAGIYQGPLVSGIAAPPFGDNTKYLSVLTGGTATLTAPALMKSLSVYLGSIDDYNGITFTGLDGFSQSFTGSALNSPANGDQSDGVTNRRYYFTFDPNDKINKVIFSSSGNSFEFDNIAVNDPPIGVPEPLTLSLFASGLAGATLLRRRRKVPA